jgi:hypothetical protein
MWSPPKRVILPLFLIDIYSVYCSQRRKFSLVWLLLRFFFNGNIFNIRGKGLS